MTMTQADLGQAERLERIFERLVDGYGIPTYDAGFLTQHIDALTARLAQAERALKAIRDSPRSDSVSDEALRSEVMRARAYAYFAAPDSDEADGN